MNKRGFALFIRTISRYTQGLFCLVFASLLALSAVAAENDFPVPDSIRPAINFWVKVYTDADTSSGFLHDSQNLAIVYEKLERDRALINTTRRQIVDDLKELATGKRTNLTSSQTRILALWPEDVSNERLATAANNVRWQLGQSDRFVAGLKRSGAYRQHIEDVVQAKGMPIELAVLPHVESSFHPGAYSSVAATGMWQFVRSTATRFMRVDYVVDERLDPYTATYAAMELLEYNYNVLGTWPLALTAYNHGANGMARAIREVGSDDIGQIISQYKGPRFGFASRNFYPQFLAVQEVETRADEFFGSLQLDPHPDFEELELSAYIDARVLSDSLGISTTVLRKYNPALQPSVWSGTKRVPAGYKVKLDRSVFTGDLLASVEAIPGSELFGEQIPDVSYRVRRGDSLSMIADRYDTSVSELVAINQLRDRHRIRIGQNLLLPQPDGAVPTLLVNASLSREIPEDGKYEVRRGDSISTISDRFRVPQEALLALNNLDNQSLIFPGQSLTLRNNPGVVQANLATAPSPQVLEESIEEIEEVQELAEEQLAINEEIADTEIPQLAQLSVDSDSTALEVNSSIQAVEEKEQLSLDLATDPSDYSVAEDNTIEIQAIETLGHYADWLGIRAWDIRRLNRMSFRQPVIIGDRLRLDFSKVDVADFERKRREFHRDLQTQYFANWRIQDTEEYRIRSRDFLVNLARERSVPMWLFRQYNPEVDSGRIQIGQVVVFPVVERVQL
ncbi:LysM peptidoglycan-binding domain-containing protein [Gammaproteobacteria bacterium]|nr:LysM peptidoglycan-binding domain-containing protein [Gammaproteobacteria bacterium]